MSREDTTPTKVLAENEKLMMSEVHAWVQRIACQPDFNPAMLVPDLLALIGLRLAQLVNNQTNGSNYYRITPVTLGNEGVKIVEKQTDGLVRTVLLWVDKASGGPTPYLRVGLQKVNLTAGQTGTGGIQVNAGTVNELGNVRADVEIWAACSTTIQAYVIEFA